MLHFTILSDCRAAVIHFLTRSVREELALLPVLKMLIMTPGICKRHAATYILIAQVFPNLRGELMITKGRERVVDNQ